MKTHRNQVVFSTPLNAHKLGIHSRLIQNYRVKFVKIAKPKHVVSDVPGYPYPFGITASGDGVIAVFHWGEGEWIYAMPAPDALRKTWNRQKEVI